jgi:hypothetical protein
MIVIKHTGNSLLETPNEEILHWMMVALVCPWKSLTWRLWGPGQFGGTQVWAGSTQGEDRSVPRVAAYRVSGGRK